MHDLAIQLRMRQPDIQARKVDSGVAKLHLSFHLADGEQCLRLWQTDCPLIDDRCLQGTDLCLQAIVVQALQACKNIGIGNV